MLILGIETSCDETASRFITASAACSRTPCTPRWRAREYGGVVPELASRDHIRRVLPLIRQVMHQAGASLADIDAVAYTQGRGWPARCWSAPASPMRLHSRSAFRRWVYTISKAICSRPCSRAIRALPFVALLSRADIRS